MDPLTGTVIAALTALFTRKAEDLANAAGDAAFAKTKEIFAKLKQRWSGDKVAADDLERFAQEPKIYAPVVSARLEAKLAEDPELRSELQRLVDEMGRPSV